MTSLQATIGRLLSWSAERFGDAQALMIPGDRSYSFADLDRAAGRLATGLASSGVGRGDRVVLHLANGWAWVVAYYAIARLGAVVVSANNLLTPAEVAFIAADAGAMTVIAAADRAEALAAAFRAGSGRQAPVMILAGDGLGNAGFERLLDGPATAPVDLAPHDLLAIGYTSGTTGRPKGAMLSHGAVFHSAAMTATSHVRTRADVVLSALPFSHVYGNIVLNAGVLAGARLIAPARFDAAEALRLIESQRVTLFEGVPTMYYQLLSQPGMDEADVSSLQRCTVGGQTMPLAKLEEAARRLGCPMLELWGMTEVAGPALTHSPYWPARLGSIGLPFPGTEVRIAPLISGGLSLQNEAGELQVRGPLVMQGYWNAPQATAEAIDADGWLSTGDIARRDEDGYVFIVDRRKDMIITGGYNIYPAEIEQAIALHPAVAMVAVGAAPDAEKGELATAYVVKRSDQAVTAAELDAHCRRHLAAYKTPRRIVFVGDLPKTSTGKIMRRALHATFAQETAAGGSP